MESKRNIEKINPQYAEGPESEGKAFAYTEQQYEATGVQEAEDIVWDAFCRLDAEVRRVSPEITSSEGRFNQLRAAVRNNYL